MQRYYTIKEVANKLGVHHDKVRYLARANHVQPFTVGHVRLFTPADIAKCKEHLDARPKK
jgi:excisionase family DNA binding protein